jgi:hypothetical protein
VRRVVRSTVLAALVGAGAAAAVYLFGYDRTDVLRDAYVVFLAFLLALAAARITRGAFPSPRGVIARTVAVHPARYSKPESLKAMEDAVALAQADQFDLHFRLRPVLADIAAAGLAMRTGLELETQPERARERFSADTWSLVRPDRPRPEGSRARGIDTASLTAVIDELETITPP